MDLCKCKFYFSIKKKSRYGLIFKSLLFSASNINYAKTICITSKGLNDAKTAIVHNKDYKTLTVVKLGKNTNCCQLNNRLIRLE